MKTEVLIIGAGPTGLMAASQLSRLDIDFIIIDKKDGPTQESRAIGVTPRSLEIYQQMGIADEVLETGVPINGVLAWSNGKKKAEVQFDALGRGLTDFHFLYAFEQSKNEELLYKYIKSNNGNVFWNTELKSLAQSKEKVEATVSIGGNTHSIECTYLIGCDGAKSLVRQQLKFQFKGGTYENKFFVADTELLWDLDYDKLIVSPSDKNFCAFFPLKGNKNYRVIGTLPKSYKDKENISFSDIEKTVKSNIGIDVSFEKVNWFSVYLLHHRCVDTFRKGKVFLAGDSAHIHSPAGAQGMNTGLQDAYNLCWKLAGVLRGHASEKLLDTYNEERLPFAQWLLKFTDRGFGVMSSDNKLLAFFRKHVALNLVGHLLKIDKLRKRMFRTVSQIAYSYEGKSLSKNYSRQPLSFRAGDRLPYLREGFYQRFNSPAFHCLHISQNALQKETVKKIKSAFPFPVQIVESNLADWAKFGVKEDLYVLVRPDHYIASIAGHLEVILPVGKYFNGLN